MPPPDSVYPAALDDFPVIEANSGEAAEGTEHDVVHEHVHQAVKALQSTVGVTGSAVAGTVHNRLDLIEGAIVEIDGELDGKAPVSHGHAIGDVTGLQTALDGKAAASHTHPWSDISSTPTTLAGYGITDADSSGSADAAVAAHEAAPDPHPGYLTEAAAASSYVTVASTQFVSGEKTFTNGNGIKHTSGGSVVLEMLGRDDLGICIVGSDTDHDLVLRRNNSERARLTAAGFAIPGALTVGGDTTIGDGVNDIATVNGWFRVNVPADHWNVNSVLSVGPPSAPYGQLDSHGAFMVTLTSNGYRNNSGTWTSRGVNGQDGAAMLGLDPIGAIRFYTDADKATGTGNTPSQRMIIDGSGNVGIGTGSPSSRLDVNGNTSITGSLNTTQGLTTGSSAQIGSGAGGIEIEINGAAGQSRDLSWASGGVHRWTFRVSNVAESGSNAGSNFEIINRNDAGAALSVAVAITRATGNVGIGTSSPGEKLAVAGNISATKAFLVDDVYQITAVTTAGQTRTLDLANSEVQIVSANQAFTINATGPAGKSGRLQLYIYNSSGAAIFCPLGTGWFNAGSLSVAGNATAVFDLRWDGTRCVYLIDASAAGNLLPT